MNFKLVHPTRRDIVEIKQYLLHKYHDYVPLPWDCVCERRCRCHLKPTPTVEQIDEEMARLKSLKAQLKKKED